MRTRTPIGPARYLLPVLALVAAALGAHQPAAAAAACTPVPPSDSCTETELSVQPDRALADGTFQVWLQTSSRSVTMGVDTGPSYGTIELFDGPTSLGPPFYNRGGQGGPVATIVTAGTHDFTAVHVPAGNLLGSTATATLTLHPATPTAVTVTVPPGPHPPLSLVSLTPTATPAVPGLLHLVLLERTPADPLPLPRVVAQAGHGVPFTISAGPAGWSSVYLVRFVPQGITHRVSESAPFTVSAQPAAPPPPAPAGTGSGGGGSGGTGGGAGTGGAGGGTGTTTGATDVRIVAVSHAGREWLRLRNAGAAARQLRGWTLTDRSGHTLTLPRYRLAAGAAVKVYTGSGARAGGKIYLGRRADVWSTHDTAKLSNRRGVLLHKLRY